jgi:glycosyltransferase involved in cell wall biosynthesis
MLIEAWARVRPEGWVLKVVGPDEGGHRIQLERTVSAAGLDEFISFAGAVIGEKKQAAFFSADLFVLPSYSENFGLVVVEALAHGLPVLTTTGAPWSRLAERGCGWWVEPTVDGIAEGLRTATSCHREALKDMGARGREWVAREFGWRSVGRQFMATYEELLAAPRTGRAA